MEATRHSRIYINVTRACVLPAVTPALMTDNMQATEPHLLYRLFNIADTSAAVIQNWNRRMETVLAYLKAGVYTTLSTSLPRD